jgi:hypothetical protein
MHGSGLAWSLRRYPSIKKIRALSVDEPLSIQITSIRHKTQIQISRPGHAFERLSASSKKSSESRIDIETRQKTVSARSGQKTTEDDL